MTNSPYSFHSSCVIETGLSDFHKITVAVTKASFQKMKPKIITFRNYKLFSNELYKVDLVFELPNESFRFNKLKRFLEICENTLNRCAPRKKKIIRGNHSPFMNKGLSKAIMKRTRLRNKFLRNKSPEKRENFNKQRNYCVHLVSKSKREYYGNLNEKNVIDNKTSCKTVKPFLSNKTTNHSKITLNDYTKVAETLNSFFTEAVLNLKILKHKTSSIVMDENESNKDIERIVEKYKHHPSVTAIKQTFPDLSFSFKPVVREDILRKLEAETQLRLRRSMT